MVVGHTSCHIAFALQQDMNLYTCSGLEGEKKEIKRERERKRERESESEREREKGQNGERYIYIYIYIEGRRDR